MTWVYIVANWFISHYIQILFVNINNLISLNKIKLKIIKTQVIEKSKLNLPSFALSSIKIPLTSSNDLKNTNLFKSGLGTNKIKLRNQINLKLDHFYSILVTVSFNSCKLIGKLSKTEDFRWFLTFFKYSVA